MVNFKIIEKHWWVNDHTTKNEFVFIGRGHYIILNLHKIIRYIHTFKLMLKGDQ